MLVSLHVKNLALIEETEVYFGPGLNILTGETGAGKSIIIGSVGLALGGRASAELIRTGADYALIELVFCLDKPGQLERVRQLELPLEEDGTVILQRRIMPQRSVFRVNGETVSAKLLRELSSVLLDIHGQHDSQQLLQSKKHMEILDDFAGGQMAELKQELREHYHSCRQLREQLDECCVDEKERERAISLALFEAKEIEAAALREGEDEELEARYRKMCNSRRIAEAMGTAYALTGYEQDGSAGDALGRALREIHSVSTYDENLEELAGMLEEIDSLLNDFNRSAADYLSDLEFDQEDFVQTEERLNLINRLKDKYGDTIEQILRYQRSREQEVWRLQNADEYLQRLRDNLAAAETRLEELCARATRIRQQEGERLSALLIEALSDMNFNQVDFAVDIKKAAKPGAEGWDDVSFSISTNPGEPRRPLAEIASGGELSRIMLALKTVTAGQEDKDTFIFDEIDAGISGRTAWKVARKLGRLAGSRQVICITHLPQIAAMADNHFVIEKKTQDGATATQIREITGVQIEEELARMLGGEELTESALANAQELRRMAARAAEAEAASELVSSARLT